MRSKKSESRRGGKEIFIYLVVLFSVCFIAFILSLFINVNQRKYKLIFLGLTFPPLLLISGLRSSEIGTDTANYIHGYNMIKNTDWVNIFRVVQWEKGYTLLNKLTSNFSYDDQSILLVTSFIILAGIFKFIYKNSPNVYFSLYLFFTMYYYFVSFNAIRQFIAISILVFGYQYIKERKMFKYFGVILLAFYFHDSVILFLPLYWIYGVKLNTRNLIIIISSFLTILIGFDYIMNLTLSFLPEYSTYVGSEFFEGSGILTTLISGSILLFGIFTRIIGEKSKEFDFLLIIMVLSFLISLLSMEITIFNRLGFYFSIFNILFIPYAINNVKQQKSRMLIYTIISLLTFSYFIIRMIEGWQRVTPYQFLI